ncbi:hypothetical protein [Streptomyces sp. NPDC048106]|uniref:hypothetical protein n=1 Tax=Streptomyces sp. NPDC048106 TaxID=3155750 RepID=UPI003456DD8F
MGDGGGADLRRGADALSKLKSGFDKALKTFDGSSGSASSLSHHVLERSSFSGTNVAFPEASGLHEQYQNVHDRIVSMSKTLGLYVEAMTLAAQAADGTYDGTEEEVRRRFWAIKSQLDKEYAETHPTPKAPEQPGKAGPKHSGGKSVGDGF